MNILSLLIPSWRFFDKVGYISKLYYRTKNQSTDYAEWTEWPPKPEIKLWNLFVNQNGNLYLAQHALIEQLLDEARDIQNKKIEKKIEETVSYQLILNALKEEIRGKSKDSFFQFKVDLITYEKDISKTEEVLLTYDVGV